MHPDYGRRCIFCLILASWPFDVCILVELHQTGIELSGISTREKVRVRKEGGGQEKGRKCGLVISGQFCLTFEPKSGCSGWRKLRVINPESPTASQGLCISQIENLLVL